MAKKTTSKKNTQQSKKAIRQQRQGKRKRQRYLRIGVVVVGLVLAAGYFLWPRPQAQAVSPDRLNDDPALGSPDAPVTIIEYGDFGCPSCQAWHNAGILDRVIATYGDQVRFVWRDFPIITAFSPEAAQAAQCAYDQDRFWDYHDLLFERGPSFRDEKLKSYAVEIGLDATAFNQCLDTRQHQATVDKDLEDAFQRRFRGTPSFLVNDQPLAGPPTFEFLQSLIEPILAAES
jgi:protein-disulfide isomerase